MLPGRREGFYLYCFPCMPQRNTTNPLDIYKPDLEKKKNATSCAEAKQNETPRSSRTSRCACEPKGLPDTVGGHLAHEPNPRVGQANFRNLTRSSWVGLGQEGFKLSRIGSGHPFTQPARSYPTRGRPFKKKPANYKNSGCAYRGLNTYPWADKPMPPRTDEPTPPRAAAAAAPPVRPNTHARIVRHILNNTCTRITVASSLTCGSLGAKTSQLGASHGQPLEERARQARARVYLERRKGRTPSRKSLRSGERGGWGGGDTAPAAMQSRRPACR